MQVMVKVSLLFQEVTRDSDPMKAIQGNRTHGGYLLLLGQIVL